MKTILNIDEPNSSYQYALGRYQSGDLPLIITGKTREAIFAFIHKNLSPRFWLGPREHFYVFYGQYWRSFNSDEKALKNHDDVTNLLRDSMAGPLVDTLAHAVTNRRRFLSLTKDNLCDLWKHQDRVRLVYEYQAEAEGGERAPHHFKNAIGASRLAR